MCQLARAPYAPHLALVVKDLAVRGRLAELTDAAETGEVSGNVLLVDCSQDKQEIADVQCAKI